MGAAFRVFVTDQIADGLESGLRAAGVGENVASAIRNVIDGALTVAIFTPLGGKLITSLGGALDTILTVTFFRGGIRQTVARWGIRLVALLGAAIATGSFSGFVLTLTSALAGAVGRGIGAALTASRLSTILAGVPRVLGRGLLVGGIVALLLFGLDQALRLAIGKGIFDAFNEQRPQGTAATYGVALNSEGEGIYGGLAGRIPGFGAPGFTGPIPTGLPPSGFGYGGSRTATALQGAFSYTPLTSQERQGLGAWLASGGAPQVTVNVAGSVISEQELTDRIRRVVRSESRAGGIFGIE